MGKLFRLILIAGVAAAVQACADHPTTASPVRSSVSPAPAAGIQTPAPSNATEAAGSVQPVALNDKTLTQSEVNTLLSQGYKPQKRGDDVVYCRSETQLGTRFPRTVCRSGSDIKAAIQLSKDETTTMDRNLGNTGQACGTAKCN